MKWLDGKKTYIGFVGLGVLGFCWSQGWITDEMSQGVGSLLSAWTGVGIAHKISKATPAGGK